MTELFWKSITVKGENGEALSDARLKLRTASVSFGKCEGTAYYVSISGDSVLSAEDTATLVPDITDTDRYMAINHHSTYWCRPFWGKSLCELPVRIQELVIEENGLYRVFLPVCASVIKTLIRGSEGGMEIYVTTNKNSLCEIPEQLSFVVMEGKSASEAMKAAAHIAAELLGNGLKMRDERPCPEVFDYLGWCSWDAFQIRVNHKGLLDKAKEFKEKNVPVHYAIIDDMWADAPHLNEIPLDTPFRDMVREMHASTLRTFEGDPERFPSGMKAAVSDLKAEGIQSVGIWFPTTGYWKGLDGDGETAKKLSDCVALGSDGRITVVPERDKAEKYFDFFCGKCYEWGADFVKIDNQGFYHNFKGNYSFGESASAVQSAIDKSSQKYFDGALINCMGMPSECLFHRTSSAVCRCSDDFMPERREWFAKNILQCAYNGLWQGQYHVNDWDMWWTDDEQAKKNSLCRAISGGPIYVSDKLGRTNAEILKPLTLKDGRILRPDNSATPTEDCIMQNPTMSEKIFKIRNRFSENGVLAVFNINAENKVCTGTVSPEDCDLPCDTYAYFEYFSQSGGVLKKGEKLNVTLSDNDEFKLYTLVPMRDGCAVMGRADLYMGIGAVTREGRHIALAESGRVAIVKEDGTLTFKDVQSSFDI